MQTVYHVRLFLKSLGSRLWPFVLMLIIFMALTSGDKSIHTISLSREVFHFVQNDLADLFTGDTFEVIGWAFFAIFCLLIIRLILKSLSSDKKLFTQLSQRIAQSPMVYRILTTYNPLNFYDRYDRSGNFFNHLADETADSHTLFRFFYYEEAVKQKRSINFQVDIAYSELSILEGWRTKTVRNTMAIVRVKPDLPEVILLSKLLPARDSALKLRLAQKDQYVELEGSFSKAYSVYVAHGNEVEAFKLLAPNIMEAIEPEANNFDIYVRGHTISFSRDEYIFEEQQLEVFKNSVKASMQTLAFYLQQEMALKKISPRSDVAVEKPKIHSLNLVTDRLIGLWFLLFILTVIVALIGRMFAHNREIGDYTILSPFNDIVELASFGMFVLMLLTMLFGEIEVAIYRIVISARRRQNLRYYQAYSLSSRAS